ncbi:hypothetical protein SFRURICE_020880 [Spodoptera frugiperda]|nr:hypothetical protein SFRURICE_020880 [Spodoptera frugiperda]
MIFPTTNTCPNTLPYPYDVHSWAEYAFYFVIIFKYVSEKNYDTRPIPSVLVIVHGTLLDRPTNPMPENQCFRPLPHSSSIMHLTIVMWNKFRTIELLWGNGWIPWFPGVILAWGSNYMASTVSKI